MIKLPKWVKPILKKLTCPFCKSTGKNIGLTAGGVTSIGISQNKNKFSLFFDHNCKECGKSCRNTLDSNPISLEEFINDLIEVNANGNFFESVDEEDMEEWQEDADELEEENEQIRKNKNERSKISDDEITDFKKMIKKCKSHEEFMLKIGMTPEDINTFKKKKENEK